MNIPGFFNKDVTPLIVVNWQDASDADKATCEWQVIYKTHAGKDYGRLSYSSQYTLSEIGVMVHKKCFHSDLAGAVIERW